MSFDALAPHYRWLEWLLAGRKLQRCRIAFLGEIASPRHALMLGEGNGRFLAAFLAAHPHARVTCVDASAAMLARARARLAAKGIDDAAVTFIHSDILRWSPPRARFDVIVSHFFLDCFQSDEIERIVEKILPLATANAHWLLADFREPTSGPAKWRARMILRAMYLFFRRVTKLTGSRITTPESFLEPRGFHLRERRLSEWGLLHTDWWMRRNPETPGGV